METMSRSVRRFCNIYHGLVRDLGRYASPTFSSFGRSTRLASHWVAHDVAVESSVWRHLGTSAGMLLGANLHGGRGLSAESPLTPRLYSFAKSEFGAGAATGLFGGIESLLNCEKAGAGKSQDKKKEDEDTSATGGPSGGSGQSFSGQLLFVLFVAAALSRLTGRTWGEEISFQTFLWSLLSEGIVDRVEVVNRSVARVYTRPGVLVDAMTTRERSGISRRDRRVGRGEDGVGAQGPMDESGTDWLEVNQETKFPTSSASTLRSGAASREPSYYFNIGNIDTFERKLQAVQEDLGIDPENFVPVTYVNESDIVSEFIRHLPTILLLGVGALMMRNAVGSFGGGAGVRGGIFQVGKANPTVVRGGETGAQSVTFKDVAGLTEAKQEVMEFVDFLKNSYRYEKLGAKIPKGALLSGPPGCGKTLLAKAAAGEASVPFFSMSGSDFIEMFVGVGPSRVRDLFAQARANAPCIVFIDEIDAVGRARGRGGFVGGNDERENTLNALLVEMDGFTSTTGVVVLAGTNRVDILDKALLRPGRFDRQISIDKPDLRGRHDIFMVHLRNLRLKDDSQSVAKRLATLTPGFSGADIANVCNEAALIAARGDKNSVEVVDFENAIDRVIGGLEKKNKVILLKEREIIAHHEAGHAVAGWFLEHADPLLKVSIIPRGSSALGFAQLMPVDRFLQSKDQLSDFIVVALGGRVAEQLCFGSVTTGAQDDLNKITRAVYAQVTRFGMSEKVGKLNFPRAGENGPASQFYKPYSERTAEIIDEEAMRIVDEAYSQCEQLLREKLDLVKVLAKRLLQKEVIGQEDLVEILGKRPFEKTTDYESVVGRFEADRRNRLGTPDDRESSSEPKQTCTPSEADHSEGGGDGGRGHGKDGSSAGGRYRNMDEPIPELS